jgi:Outer membrane receptor for ferrienterochelin and colicins
MDIHQYLGRFASGLFLAVLLVSPAAAFADDEETEEEKKNKSSSEVQTQTIMVTASRVEADLFELPMTVNVITAEDLQREPVTNITDALATIPGITFTDAGLAGAKRVSIRGEDISRTLILVNGVKTLDKRNAQTAVLIDPSQIERIEIIKGPASVLYGSEAIGGVINIITKKGGTGKPVSFSQNFVVDTSTNSLNVRSAIFGDYNGFNYRFSGNGVNVGERKVPSSGDISTADKSNYKNRYYSGQLGYKWDKGSFNLQADRYESEVYYALGDAVADMGIYMKLPKNDRDALVGTLELNDLNRYLPKVVLTGSYQNIKRDMMTFSSSSEQHVASDQDQYGLTGVSEWTLGAHYLTFGFDYEYDDVIVDASTTYAANPTNNMAHNSHVEQTTLGVFLQDEWTLPHDFKLTGGLRQTWLEGKFISKEGSSFRIPPKNSRKYDDLVASLGVVYTGFEDWALRAQWSQGTRYPTISQMFTGTAGHGAGTNPTYPNPDLEPETSNSYEIGARYKGGGWNIDGALFYTEAKNFIDGLTVYDPVIGSNISTYRNASKAETIGAELALGYTFESTGLNPYGNVTWLRRTTTSAAGYKTDKNQIPPLQGRIGLKWGMDVNDSQRVFTDLYCNWATEAERNTRNAAGVVSNTKYQAWQSLNLTLGIEGGEEHKYNASLSLRNIGNQHYVTSRGSGNLPEPGFHVVLGLGFEY